MLTISKMLKVVILQMMVEILVVESDAAFVTSRRNTFVRSVMRHAVTVVTSDAEDVIHRCAGYYLRISSLLPKGV